MRGSGEDDHPAMVLEISLIFFFNDEKNIHDFRVKVPALFLRNDPARIFVRKTFFIAALAPKSVINIGQSHDPARERDCVAFQALRIAGAVPFFMVRGHDLDGDLQKRLEVKFFVRDFKYSRAVFAVRFEDSMSDWSSMHRNITMVPAPISR